MRKCFINKMLQYLGILVKDTVEACKLFFTKFANFFYMVNLRSLNKFLDSEQKKFKMVTKIKAKEENNVLILLNFDKRIF